jgi:hypothetical protein
MRFLRDGWRWLKQRCSDRLEHGVWNLDTYRQNPDVSHPGRPGQRWLYRFWDGSRVRIADPLRVDVQLLARLDGEPAGAVRGPEDTVTDGDGTAAALAKVVAAVRLAFNVQPAAVDDDGAEVGLTDKQCLELLSDFVSWFKATSSGRWPDALRSAAASARQVVGE